MFELKPLSSEAIAGALGKAERYRLLNEPGEAESICLDVLNVDPGNQQALVLLLLALTDQLDQGVTGAVNQAREVVPQLRSEYDRAYYAGIICERRAKAQLKEVSPGAGFIAYDWLLEAMALYERAEALRPPGNDDALLRWNTCARILMKNPHLQPPVEERFETFLE